MGTRGAGSGVPPGAGVGGAVRAVGPTLHGVNICKKSVVASIAMVEQASIWRTGPEHSSGRTSAHSHKRSPVSPRAQENIQQRPGVLHNTNMKTISPEGLSPSILQSSSSSFSSPTATKSPACSSGFCPASVLRSSLSGMDSYASVLESAHMQKEALSSRTQDIKSERSQPKANHLFTSKLPTVL